ncbi:MAG: hypothetical protein ACK4Q5_17850 [Saprospiraceae bacterium]
MASRKCMPGCGRTPGLLPELAEKRHPARPPMLERTTKPSQTLFVPFLWRFEE